MGELTFYFDRNFGKRFPEGLARIKPPFSVEYHHSTRNRFPPTMPDDEWLQICGERGWVAFTQDRFDKLPIEAAAVKQHRVAAFSLWGAQLPVWDKFCHFASAYPRLLSIIKVEKPPFFYRVPHTLRLTKIDLA